MKDSEERYLLGQKHNLQFFGVIPFAKLQNDTKTTVKRWKTMKMRREAESLISVWLSYVIFLSDFF